LSVNNSQIIGSTNAISITTTTNEYHYNAYIGASQLSGGVSPDLDPSIYHCVGVYDENYNALDETCQVP